MVSTENKEKIAEHLILSSILHIAAKEVLENRDLSITDVAIKYKLMEEVATKYGLEYRLLFRKVDIMERKEEFYDRTQRLDAARKEIIEGRSTHNAAANNYGLSRISIHRAMKTACDQENYKYDRKIESRGTFSYLQEESLLIILKDWAKSESSKNRCSCTFCALEKLITLAYEFAKENNINCPLWDTLKQASIGWLIDFEMRHTDEINNSFFSFLNVLKPFIG